MGVRVILSLGCSMFLNPVLCVSKTEKVCLLMMLFCIVQFVVHEKKAPVVCIVASSTIKLLQ